MLLLVSFRPNVDDDDGGDSQFKLSEAALPHESSLSWHPSNPVVGQLCQVVILNFTLDKLVIVDGCFF